LSVENFSETVIFYFGSLPPINAEVKSCIGYKL
jgi:hypothetical protein